MIRLGCNKMRIPNKKEKPVIIKEEKVVIPEVEPEVVKPKRKRRKKNEDK